MFDVEGDLIYRGMWGNGNRYGDGFSREKNGTWKRGNWVKHQTYDCQIIEAKDLPFEIEKR